MVAEEASLSVPALTYSVGKPIYGHGLVGRVCFAMFVRKMKPRFT